MRLSHFSIKIRVVEVICVWGGGGHCLRCVVRDNPSAVGCHLVASGGDNSGSIYPFFYEEVSVGS